MKPISRRRFLKGAATTAAAATVPFSAWSAPADANGDLRIAVIGVGGKGSSHLNDLLGKKGVRVVAVADPDLNHAKRAAKRVTDKKQKCDAYQDLRKLLDRKDIDGVVIATPNHWHTLATIWACQAGKHVYVEKPVTHNIWEGKQLIAAAKKYNCVVQGGHQRRSDGGWDATVKYLEEGKMGKILCSRGLCYKRRGSIGMLSEPLKVSDSIDLNVWTGPAQMQPILRPKLHYDWHWDFNTGNGDIGNQGVHQTDVARWCLSEDTHPVRVISVGGRFGYKDAANTPNTQIVYYEYRNGPPMIFEVRGLPRKTGYDGLPDFKGIRVGNVVHCEGGYIAEKIAYDNDGKRMEQFRGDGGGGHMNNWLEAVRNHKPDDVNCSPHEGHLSAALCHLGNISHRLGQTAPEGEIREALQADDEAVATFERMKEHLAMNDIKLDEENAVLGPWLGFDSDAERFTGHFADRANAILSDQYRGEFTVPAKV